jgi:hypothetical protein
MHKPDVVADVRRRLLRNGFAHRYANGVARELEDHWVDLVEENLRQGHTRVEAEAQANAHLGDARVLAEDFSARMRQTSWLGRHPALGFSLLAIFATVLWWGLWLAAAGSATGVVGWRPAFLAVAPRFDLMISCVEWIRIASYIAIPWFICFVAHRYHCGWKPALWGCLIVAAHNSTHDFSITGPPGHGSIAWGYSFSSNGPELFAVLAPVGVFIISMLWNLRPERAEDDPCDLQLADQSL